MMSAPSAGSAYVSGSSIAMVGTGPSPGRTPIAVPSTTPMVQKIRLSRLSAAWKPSIRFENRSTGSASQVEIGPERQLQTDAGNEGEVRRDRQADAEGHRRAEPEALFGARRDEDGRDRRDVKAGEGQKNGERQDRGW